MNRNRVEDGPSCSGCGLPNYSGLCPHCRGDESEFRAMWASDRAEQERRWTAAEDARFMAEAYPSEPKP